MPINYFTGREAQILELIAQGCTDKQIAMRLGISLKTISALLGRLYRRKGIHTRTEAVVMWLANSSKLGL